LTFEGKSNRAPKGGEDMDSGGVISDLKRVLVDDLGSIPLYLKEILNLLESHDTFDLSLLSSVIRNYICRKKFLFQSNIKTRFDVSSKITSDVIESMTRCRQLCVQSQYRQSVSFLCFHFTPLLPSYVICLLHLISFQFTCFLVRYMFYNKNTGICDVSCNLIRNVLIDFIIQHHFQAKLETINRLFVQIDGSANASAKGTFLEEASHNLLEMANIDFPAHGKLKL
jgi:hypothetical protein